MPYALSPSRPVEREVRRIADRQLAHAIEHLRGIGDRRSDAAIHDARRRIKKVRALLRLVQPALGDTYDSADKRLRNVSRMLAPIADGQAVVDTIGRLKRAYGAELAPRTVASIRAVLLHRAAHIDRKAALDRVLRRAAGLLRMARREVEFWDLDARGYHAIAPGFEQTLRRARKAMKRAAVHPTADHYHAWRRRVKDLWFQVRLIEARCGGKLAQLERRLERLDGVLGEYHNVVLLEDVLLSEALLSRPQVARCLHPLRRYQTALRRQAVTLGRAALDEKPRQLLRRVASLWKTSTLRSRAAPLRAPWPRAA